MFLYKIRNKIRKAIIENFQYYWNFLKSQSIKSKKKSVFIDVRDITLNRYLYNFIKFFQLNEYTVYLPKDKKMFCILSKNKGEFRFGSWILEEKIKFGKPKVSNLVITRTQLSNDYFVLTKGLNQFHVPMSEYPAFYFYGVEIPIMDMNNRRKNSVFMSGNMDATYYNEISKSRFFEILSRRDIAEFIMKQPYYLDVDSLDDLNNYINADIDFKVILIDTKEKFRIPFSDLKTTLIHFNFYLALPGILIPQSHNLIEAMSVGCIPVIHNNYAALLTPVLKHMENAIVYCNLKELDAQLLGLFDLDEHIIDSMQQNVYEYYQNYLSPKSIVNKIEHNDFSKIYIQAEGKSLEFLNGNFS
jgi:hypothetical protein